MTLSSNSLSTEPLKETRDVPLFCQTPQEKTLSHYFETLNKGDFEATAMLFAEDGVLHPPFEAQVVGREEIILYLSREANGIKLLPQQLVMKSIDECKDGFPQFTVLGAVKTAFFEVNVRWSFELDASNLIKSAEVKLLANLRDLLTLNRQKSTSDEN